MEQTLDKIRIYADKAHGNQLRKYTPDRHIVHPIRVMRLCQIVSTDLPLLACALLHDVLEDTPISEKEIYDFLKPLLGNPSTEKTIKLVIELTDVYTKDNYPELNRRERKTKELLRIKTISPEAQTIKYADILDNCLEILHHDSGFAPIFLNECRQLLHAMEKGDRSLCAAALKVVNNNLKRLKNKPKLNSRNPIIGDPRSEAIDYIPPLSPEH